METMKMLRRAFGISALGGMVCGCGVDNGATPEIVLVTKGSAIDLAIDGPDLIFTESGGDDSEVSFLQRASLDGSDQRTLATIPNSVCSQVAIGGDSVFIGGQQYLVLEVPRAGGEPTSFGGYELSHAKPIDIAADSKGVWVAAKPSWNPEVLPPGYVDGHEQGANPGQSFQEDGVIALAIDETHVYWATRTSVRRRLRSWAGPEEIIAEDQAAPVALAVTKTHVVWLNVDSVELMAARKNGGAPEILASNDRSCGAGVAPHIVADDDAVYFFMTWAPVEKQKPGQCIGKDAIFKVSPLDGVVVMLSSHPEISPERFAVGPDHVYYTGYYFTDGPGPAIDAIARVPKRAPE